MASSEQDMKNDDVFQNDGSEVQPAESTRLRTMFKASTALTVSKDFKLDRTNLVLSYWKQNQIKDQTKTLKRKTLGREEIQRYIDEVLHVSWNSQFRICSQNITIQIQLELKHGCRLLHHTEPGFRKSRRIW